MYGFPYGIRYVNVIYLVKFGFLEQPIRMNEAFFEQILIDLTVHMHNVISRIKTIKSSNPHLIAQ